MDFVRYAERAAELLDAPLSSTEDLTAYLADRAWLVERIDAKDLRILPRFQRDLRAIFTAADAGDEHLVVDLINELLAKHPVRPYIAGDGPDSWHIHVGHSTSSVSELLVAEALVGLGDLVCGMGARRLGVCQAESCERAFVDTSPNNSRRYCSDRCSSRANVAAYRARKKAGATGVVS